MNSSFNNKDFLDNWKKYNAKLKDLEIVDNFLIFENHKIDISHFSLNSLLLNSTFHKHLYQLSSFDFYNIVKVNNLNPKKNNEIGNNDEDENEISIEEFNRLLSVEVWKPKTQKLIRKFLNDTIKPLVEYEDYLISDFSEKYLRSFYNWLYKLRSLEKKNINQSFIQKEYDKIMDDVYENKNYDNINQLKLQNTNVGFISAIAIISIISQIGIFIAALLFIKS